MMFKNETEQNVKYRTGAHPKYDWHTVRPGEEVELPVLQGEVLNITKLEEENVPEQEEPLVVPSQQDEEESDEEPEQVLEPEPESVKSAESVKEYKDRLISIDGVGKKRAKEIMTEFPTQEALLNAIREDKELHERDDIDAALYEEFGSEA